VVACIYLACGESRANKSNSGRGMHTQVGKSSYEWCVTLFDGKEGT